MDRTFEQNKGNKGQNKPEVSRSNVCHCSICGERFLSRSRFDAICNLCWADNEMRPYQIGAVPDQRLVS